MVSSVGLPDAGMHRITIRPNCSLSWRQSMLFLGTIAVPLLVVSVVLAIKGYWLVLPFAGLELAALFAALYIAAHAACRCEVISIDEEAVTVEKGRDRGHGPEPVGPEQRTRFTRAWARVELAPGTERRHPHRLWISASGKRVEIGGFLADGEKAELAAELHRLLAA